MVRRRRMAAGPEPAPCHDTGNGRRRRWVEPWNGMPTPWAKAFAEGGPKALVFEQTGGSPALDVEQRGELMSAVEELPSQAGIGRSNSNWQAVREFVEQRFGLPLSRSSCLNYPVSSTIQALHRSGFVLKRPRKRLVKAGPSASGRRSWREYCGADGHRRHGPETRYSSPTRPTFRPMRSYGTSRC